MAGVETQRSGRPRNLPGKERPQSGQVLVDALIALALIAGAALALGRAAHALVERAEQRHREVIVTIETENAAALGNDAQLAK